MPHELNDTGITFRESAAASNEAVGLIELPWYGKRYTVEVIFEGADVGILTKNKFKRSVTLSHAGMNY